MQLDSMRGWLKALVVLAALMGGLPSVAWAHAGHHQNAQPVSARQSLVSMSAAGPQQTVASAHRQLPGGGPGTALLPCCCPGGSVSCSSSSSGVQSQRAWDLAALARLAKVICDPGDRSDYASPHYRLDRPPKA